MNDFEKIREEFKKCVSVRAQAKKDLEEKNKKDIQDFYEKTVQNLLQVYIQNRDNLKISMNGIHEIEIPISLNETEVLSVFLKNGFTARLSSKESYDSPDYLILNFNS